jgi:hydroxypyruvate isomerase
VVRAVNHPQVQFLYDIFHEQMGFGNLIEKLEKNIDVIGLIHVADVPGRHEPGTGEINYANIYRKLAGLNYKKKVAMEFYAGGRSGGGTQGREVCRAQSMTFAECNRFMADGIHRSL